jgi:hypothetical protein
MTLEEIRQMLLDEDPDYWKVDNSDPSKEFAFDVPGSLTIGQVAAFTYAEAAQKITGIDDYNQPVLQIPLRQTTRHLAFDFFNATVVLPFLEESIPVALFVHTAALLVLARMQSKRFGAHRRRKILGLPFCRFYCDHVEHWWDVTLYADAEAPPE